MAAPGAIACGHALTAAAAAEILEDGGNAVDAAVAAALAACVAEPVLASPGGGGFLLARAAGGETRLFDFFAHTPQQTNPAAHLYAIEADFGPATQTFHIGPAAAAVPGFAAGLHAAHRWGGRLPFVRLAEPACRLASAGVKVNAFQGYIFRIVRPIFEATPEAAAVFGGLETGQRLRQPQLAESLDALAREGPELFYRGEIGQRLARLCAESGGHLTLDDLSDYRVVQRAPLAFDYAGYRLATNPPPSAGGLLIRFALSLLTGNADDAVSLATALERSNALRARLLSGEEDPDALLAGERAALLGGQLSRGTTQISIVDAAGTAVATTLSNGEGCGHLIPGTGIMINNMLGEEDINPSGIGAWPANERLGSMMAPTLAQRGEAEIWALGSGGSNRIRSAMTQVLRHLLDGQRNPVAAVAAPRLHVEGRLVSLEPGFDAADIARLEERYDLHAWHEQNLFFGGVHVAGRRNMDYVAAGDPRRGGSQIA